MNKSILKIILLKILFFLLLVFFPGLVASQHSDYKIFIKIPDSSSILKRNIPKFPQFIRDSSLIYKHLDNNILSLHKKGYLEASFDTVIFNNKTIKIFFWQGPKYTFTIENIDNTGHKRNLTYSNYSDLLKFKEKKLKLLENTGYPFASIALTNISQINNLINCNIQISKNEYFTYGEIKNKGNLKLNNKILFKYLNIKNENTYNEAEIQKITQKVKKINFIQEIKPPVIEFYGNKADIYLYIDKKKSNYFDGLVGLTPKDKNSTKVKFTGNIKLYLENSFRIGEKISFNWKKPESESQNLNTYISIPYIILQFGSDISLQIQKKDSSYINTVFTTGISYSYEAGNSIQLFLKQKNSKKLNKSLTSNLNQNYKTIFYGILYSVNKLNNTNNPSNGLNYTFSASLGDKIDDENLKTKQAEFLANFNFYIPIIRKFVLNISALGSYLYSDKDIANNENYLIGGQYSIRGIDEESIATQGFSVFSLGMRYIPDESISFYNFFDLGVYKNKIGVNSFNKYPKGFGFGLKFYSKAGLFDLSYAIGKHNEDNFSFKKAKVYIGVTNNF